LLSFGAGAAVLVLAVSPAFAQTQTSKPQPKPVQKPLPIAVRPQPQPSPGQPRFAQTPFASDPLTMSADLVEAMRLVATNPDAALAMLHKLNARSPNRDDILTRLAYTLQAVEKTDSAAYYYKQALAVNPLNLEAGKALGSIYFAGGKEQQAMSVFNGLLAANEYSVSAYRMVSTAIRDLGRPDEAVNVLEDGRARAKQKDPNGRSVGAFTVEIAGYYKQMGNSRRALDEYLDFAAAEPRNFRFVRDRMIQVIADDDRNRTMLVGYMQTRVDKGGASSFVAADVLAAYHLQQVSWRARSTWRCTPTTTRCRMALHCCRSARMQSIAPRRGRAWNADVTTTSRCARSRRTRRNIRRRDDGPRALSCSRACTPRMARA
jgi:tetratricopeptide (TPR) repeat protein